MSQDWSNYRERLKGTENVTPGFAERVMKEFHDLKKLFGNNKRPVWLAVEVCEQFTNQKGAAVILDKHV